MWEFAPQQAECSKARMCSCRCGSRATFSRSGPCGRMVAMAKTGKRAPTHIGPQALPGVWTPQELRDAFKKPSLAAKVKMLREAGILDSRGKLAKKYRSREIGSRERRRASERLRPTGDRW